MERVSALAGGGWAKDSGLAGNQASPSMNKHQNAPERSKINYFVSDFIALKFSYKRRLRRCKGGESVDRGQTQARA